MAVDKSLRNRSEEAPQQIPFGPLGIVPSRGEEDFIKEVDSYLQNWRKDRDNVDKGHILFTGYERDSYIVDADIPRFGTGEGKAVYSDSVRGYDLYFICDVTNSAIEYKVNGQTNHYSPDDHFQDLKRLISASAGRAKRMTVIMPYLYEGRQNARKDRESLDCAQMLQELVNMGVSTIVTFDAHEPRVQNAIPLSAFETVTPVHQNIKALLNTVDDLIIDSDHMSVVSPDEAGMSRAIFFANCLGLDMGMFYKRRDYSVEGNPVVASEFLGSDVTGQDVLIVDDMISSGSTMIDIAKALKKRGAKRVFCFGTFGLFTGGLNKFDDAYEVGLIDKVFTTDLIRRPDGLRDKPWHVEVKLAKYTALIIDTLNHNESLQPLLEPFERINLKLNEYRNNNGKIQ
ncbi:MAG: ribose-phosphate pyrophosphokinase [Eubacteriales bacterium]|nr:ribose-phosphate pyrophosphokinase [Eubacteriales bacterium]